MDLGLPFHSCTFDNITMMSSGLKGNGKVNQGPLFDMFDATDH